LKIISTHPPPTKIHLPFLELYVQEITMLDIKKGVCEIIIDKNYQYFKTVTETNISVGK